MENTTLRFSLEYIALVATAMPLTFALYAVCIDIKDFFMGKR